MKTPRIYVDTSVVGGCFDPEFAPWSNGLVEDFRAGRFIPVLSDLLSLELEGAPQHVRTLHSELLTISSERVTASDAALELLSLYETRSVLGPKYRADMLHIALATVADVDVLVSWNFKHIVRFDKIRLFNAANLEQGYRQLAIHSPREVTTYGNDRDQGS
ncbi:MAG: PIN domain protein [Gemmatimonadota bacterium]